MVGDAHAATAGPAIDVTIDLPDGVYDAHVATSEFAPISLILGGAS